MSARRPDLFGPEVQRDAYLSGCGKYRYELTRVWEPMRPGGNVLWVMLNPSTADASIDDPTIRRCVGFSRAWGYGSLTVVNLFALRATNPGELYHHGEPVGPENDEVIGLCAEAAELVIVAWGNHGFHRGRDTAVLRLLDYVGRPVQCLGLTKFDRPRHPLYVPAKTKPVAF